MAWSHKAKYASAPQPLLRHVPKAAKEIIPVDIWSVYAAVKYWSRDERGPRGDGGEVTLDELARALAHVLEAAWRQGIRNERLVAATRKLVKRS